MDDKESSHSELTVVYVEQGLARAHVVKGKLESAGIPVLLDYESAGPAMGIMVDGLGRVRILVPADRADEARSLLAPSC
jgi:hypothetical protein